MSLRPVSKVQNPYPAPEQEARLERSSDGTDGLRDVYGAEEPVANQKSDENADLSEWQEDETQWNSRRDTRRGVRWCESAAYTPPGAEKGVRLDGTGLSLVSVSTE